jgi:hypothetical protein
MNPSNIHRDNPACDFGTDGREVAESTVATLGRRVQETAGNIGEKAREVGQKAREVASNVASTAGETANTVVSGVKTGVAQGYEGMCELTNTLTNIIRRNPIPTMVVGLAFGYFLGRITTRK